MPPLQTFARSVKSQLTVSIPREYDGCSFEVIMIPVAQPPQTLVSARAPRRRIHSASKGQSVARELEEFVSSLPKLKGKPYRFCRADAYDGVLA